MDDNIKLLVESEHFSTSDYDVKPISEDVIKSTRLTEDENCNIKRFLGHDSTLEYAVRRARANNY